MPIHTVRMILWKNKQQAEPGRYIPGIVGYEMEVYDGNYLEQ